jgi:hypothetical protein
MAIFLFITLGQYVIYYFIFMVIWSGGVFLFHAKSTPKPKPYPEAIEFNSLKQPDHLITNPPVKYDW